jgi:IclR family transcriptional regulator, KDG regulon repressor
LEKKRTNPDPKYPVQTLEKSIEVIELLSTDGFNGGLGISELSNKLGIGKSTIHRILDTLLAYNFVEKCSENSKYRLGWKLFEIGNLVPQQRNLSNFDIGILQDLCNKYQETVNLGVRVKDKVVTISRMKPKTSLVASHQIGSQEPLHATSTGKALICQFSREELIEILGDGPFEAFTRNTITSMDQLVTELEKIKAQNYSIDDEELCAGLSCIAMPVRNFNNEIIAAISVSGPTTRLNFSKIMSIKEGLEEASRKLADYLGHRL